MGQTMTITVPQGTTLIRAMLDQALPIPFSCTTGTCTTCRARCLAGSVHMANDEGLSEEERQDGYVLTCVGYPATEHVTLSFDV